MPKQKKPSEVETLRAENADLKQQLAQLKRRFDVTVRALTGQREEAADRAALGQVELTLVTEQQPKA